MIRNIVSFARLKPAISVGFLFSVSSLLFGIWVASIPGIKDRMNFTDATLGLSLLLSPLGAITGVLLSTRIFRKLPVGDWMFNGYLLLTLIMILQINAVNRPMLWGCLYAFGFVSFLNGVSVNSTVSLIEKKYERHLMSTCHAMYSLGGGVSSGLAALFFSVGVASGRQIMVVAAGIFVVLLVVRPWLVANRDIIHSGSGLRLPSLSILGISFICMVVFMSEGCVADWSAIYLKETLGVAKQYISLGFAGFATAMTIGRFNGDDLIRRIGNRKIVIGGMLLACSGFVVVVLATHMAVVIAGFVLVGMGCSCVVPVLFSTATRIPGLSSVEGFAMVTTGGLIGFLTGPSVIGFISESVNLSAGLSLLILMTLLAAYTGWRNRFLGGGKPAARQTEYDEQLY